MAQLGDFDKAFSLAVSAYGGRHGWADELAKALTELGKTPVYLAIILAMSASNRAFALALLAMLAATEVLNKLLKALVRRERPFEAYPEPGRNWPLRGSPQFPLCSRASGDRNLGLDRLVFRRFVDRCALCPADLGDRPGSYSPRRALSL